MPLTLIQTVLGLGFVFVWTFIAAMVLRDGQFAARSEREMRQKRGHSTFS